MAYHWEDLNWREFGELVPSKIDTVILPVGTIEAHGATNLGTDVTIPAGLAERIADEINAVIAPPIYYGVTRTLYDYPGSLSISPETLQKTLEEILAGMANHGITRVVILNGHGGNNNALKEAAFSCGRRFKLKMVVVHWWELCASCTPETYGTDGGHAAVDETAAVMAIDPDMVFLDRYDDDERYFYRSGAYVYPIPSSILIYKEDTGRLDFDEERAKQYLDCVVKKLLDFIKEVFSRWEKNLG